MNCIAMPNVGSYCVQTNFFFSFNIFLRVLLPPFSVWLCETGCSDACMTDIKDQFIFDTFRGLPTTTTRLLYQIHPPHAGAL